MKLRPEGRTQYTPHRYPRVVKLGINIIAFQVEYRVTAEIHFPKEKWGQVPIFGYDRETRNERLREILARLLSGSVVDQDLEEALRSEYDLLIPGGRD